MFTESENIEKLWNKMFNRSNRIQRRDETIFTYFYDKMIICKHINLSEIEKKNTLSTHLLKILNYFSHFIAFRIHEFIKTV